MAAESSFVTGEKVHFTKFDGGVMVRVEAELVEVTDKFVVLSHDGASYSFRRDPGSKSGYGVGKAKAWRINDDGRKRFCYPDEPRRR